MYSTDELMYSTDEHIQQTRIKPKPWSKKAFFLVVRIHIANLVQKFSNWLLESRKFCRKNILFY